MKIRRDERVVRRDWNHKFDTMFAYRPPSADILNCRRAFHTSQKGSTESTTDWFQRLSKLSGACEYASIADIILIDKFLSGIDANFYPRIVNETYLDANKLLTIALDIEEAAATIGNNANHDVSMKIETDDGLHQVNWPFPWFLETVNDYDIVKSFDNSRRMSSFGLQKTPISIHSMKMKRKKKQTMTKKLKWNHLTIHHPLTNRPPNNRPRKNASKTERIMWSMKRIVWFVWNACDHIRRKNHFWTIS